MRFGVPKKVWTEITGAWASPGHHCACGTLAKECPDHARHAFKAFRQACLKDPRRRAPVPLSTPEG